jgi:hypothetical protein
MIAGSSGLSCVTLITGWHALRPSCSAGASVNVLNSGACFMQGDTVGATWIIGSD